MLVCLHVHVRKCYALRSCSPYLCLAYVVHMSLDIFASCFKLLPSIFFYCGYPWLCICFSIIRCLDCLYLTDNKNYA